jgi:thiol-disulfide isomerase/thioredoxin
MINNSIKGVLYYLTFIIFAFSCAGPSENRVKEQQVPIVDFEGLKPLLSKQNDTTYVVNFWATWCAPCIKELPHFERLNQEYSDTKLKVILVSLDFPNHFDSRLIPFIKEMDIKSEVILLDDPNSNYWIDQVSPDWSGAIPSTLIYNRNARMFFEKEFSYDELKQIVDNMITMN